MQGADMTKGTDRMAKYKGMGVDTQCVGRVNETIACYVNAAGTVDDGAEAGPGCIDASEVDALSRDLAVIMTRWGDERFDTGNEEGYKAGDEEGYRTGNEEGYKTGHEEGYGAGYDDNAKTLGNISPDELALMREFIRSILSGTSLGDATRGLSTRQLHAWASSYVGAPAFTMVLA